MYRTRGQKFHGQVPKQLNLTCTLFGYEVAYFLICIIKMIHCHRRIINVYGFSLRSFSALDAKTRSKYLVTFTLCLVWTSICVLGTQQSAALGKFPEKEGEWNNTNIQIDRATFVIVWNKLITDWMTVRFKERLRWDSDWQPLSHRPWK